MNSFLSNYFGSRKGEAAPHSPSARFKLQVVLKVIVGKPLMKALAVNALGRGFELDDIDIAAPIGREVLVDVQTSGLCHTVLLFASHDIVPMPAVLGHEVAGIVAEIGPDVREFRFGDHVAGSLAQSCGACARCQSGRSFQCLHPESTLRRRSDPPRLSRRGALHSDLNHRQRESR
jgi:Zn-dependent alcohol dehydrogenase